MQMAVGGSRATLGGVTGLRGIGTRAAVTSSPAGCSLAGAALARRVRGPILGPAVHSRRVTVRAAAAEDAPPKQVCGYPPHPSLTPHPRAWRPNPKERVCDRGHVGRARIGSRIGGWQWYGFHSTQVLAHRLRWIVGSQAPGRCNWPLP